MLKTSIFASFMNYKGDTSLLSVLTCIRDGRYEASVSALRSLLDEERTDEAERLKKQLLAFTVSATYSGKRQTTYLTAYHPLVVLDLDKLPAEQIEPLRKRIEQAPYTVACFLSPSGRGLKAIVYAAVDMERKPANHRKIFDRVKKWYEQLLGVTIDPSGSDVGRLCFVSYDPALYLSPRFLRWLEGGDEGTLPTDLPLLSNPSPRPPATRGKQLLEKARKRMAGQDYTEGNRNNYVYRFACHANRLGASKEEALAYCAEHFADLGDDERTQAVESAYTHVEERGTERAQQQQQQRVERVCAYLSRRYHLRCNVERGVVEYRRKWSKDKRFHPVTDHWENSVWRELQKEGCLVRLHEVHAVVYSDFSEEYDPFVAYFNSLPAWDGVTDHIARLAQTVVTDRPDYWYHCLKKWLVATVACATDPTKENHSVLLLSGSQGIGKTTWCRRLVPPALAEYVYSGNVDPSSKDALLLLSDCFLIILDELSGQSRMELNRLKAMITKDAVRERRAYARNAEWYVRRASFVATVNDSQVLTDRTGSRRFLCFEAKQIDYTAPIDHAAIYAQARALLQTDFKYWFSDNDIIELNRNNEDFQQSSPEEELFFTYFRRPERFDAPLYLSSSEILSKIALNAKISVNTLNVVNLGKVLKKEGFEQKRHYNKRTYAVIELNFEQVKARQMGISTDGDSTRNSDDNKKDNGLDASEQRLPF